MNDYSVSNDLTTQDLEMGSQTMENFLDNSRGYLSFFDGFEWRKITSKTHLAQLEKALSVYLDKQLEHVEYTLALTMSKRRGEVFEVYQKAVSEISSRIRDHAINYREQSKKRVMDTLERFMKEADAFDNEIKSSGISSSRMERLLRANEELTNKNFDSIFKELTTELDHYHEMCKKIYVGMSEEVEMQRNRINNIN